LFVGRIQPLKGVDVAVRTLAELDHSDACLVVVGGASGREGPAEERRIRCPPSARASASADRVHFRATTCPPQPLHLVQGGRCPGHAEPLRVVRPRRP
jgi:D-inositol-3-phosphate glycosyltransferase